MVDHATSNATVTLSVEAAKSAYARAKAHDTTSMLSVNAPAAVGSQRPPLEIVAVVDVSGSMSGENLKLLKQALSLLVSRAGLDTRDKFGIVAFSDTAQDALPLQFMDATGLAKAKQVVGSLVASGGTNLSSGVLHGIKMLVDAAASHADQPAHATRSVLLFTDGQANRGIVKSEELIKAVTGALLGAPTQIFTFGFGSSHNEDLLLSLSRTTIGQYYFITAAEAIPTAFADCLGGLVSVVAQGATLEIKAAGGRRATVSVGKLLGDAYTTTRSVDGVLTVHIGDLYSEDAKDLLVEIRLEPVPSSQPTSGSTETAMLTSAVAAASMEGWTLIDKLDNTAVAAPLSEETGASEAAAAVFPAVEAKLRYFNVASCRFEEVEALLNVARPEDASDATTNLVLDEHLNRITVAEALKRAAHIADSGDVEAGRAILTGAINSVICSPSSCSRVSRALTGDIKRLAMDYDEPVVYRSTGSKRSKTCAMSYGYQRSTHDQGHADSSYTAGSASKAAMQRAWTLPEPA